MSHFEHIDNKDDYKDYIVDGRWRTVGVNGKRRLGMWKDDNYDQALLFEFRKNGKLKVYIDQDDDWNFKRKKDVLVGHSKPFKEDTHPKDALYSKSKGKLELFVFGYEARIQVDNEVFGNNADGYEYYLKLDEGRIDSKTGSNIYRSIALNKNAYGLIHQWFHNGDITGPSYGEVDYDPNCFNEFGQSIC